MDKHNNSIPKAVRLLAVLLALALAVTGCGAATSENGSRPPLGQSGNEVKEKASFAETDGTLRFYNDKLSVELDTATGEFAVTVAATGHVFRSNPTDKDAEGSGRGVQKMKLYSQLLVSFMDKSNNTPVSKISHTGSVTKDGFSYEKLENGVRLNYRFPDEGITVPLELLLTGDILTARVDVANVADSDNYRLYAFSILPYFGSANAQSEGYLVIPDGSGALVDFQTDRSNVQPYNQPIYGLEPAYTGDLTPETAEKILLPVFGISKPDGAFLAEITRGTGAASLDAYAAGMINHHNTIYPSFQVIGSGTVTIGESNQGAVKETVMYHNSRRLLDCAQVDYRFMTEDTSYVGMAKVYREVLQSRGVGSAQAKDARVYSEFVGGVLKKESVFGFLMDRHKALTTAEQALVATKELKALMGDDLSVIYTDWSKNEIGGLFPTDAKVDGVVGKEKELKALASALTDRLWLSYEPLVVQKSGNGFSTYSDSVKRIGREAVRLWYYRLSTGYKDSDRPASYVAKTGILSDGFASFKASLDKSMGDAAGLYSATLGNMSFTDFSTDTVIRDEAIADMVAVLKAGGKWTLSQPAAYALPYTAVATDVPVASSGFDLFTEDVPFYQLCLSGLVGMTTACVNEQTDPQTAVLNAAETGSSLLFRFFCEDTTVIRDTAKDDLCYAVYASWQDDVKELYTAWRGAADKTAGATVTSRTRLDNGVYKTMFDNGVTVYVNYGDSAAEADGLTVAARGFAVQ